MDSAAGGAQPALDYVARVNRAIDFVLMHLDEALPLERVARAADFSPYHFHRIFRSLVGETLAQFVKRVRLERALKMVSHQPELPLTEVALACGFGSSSDFSRSFKQRFGLPPSAFDVAAFRAERREEFESAAGPDQRHLLKGLAAGENPDGFEVRMRRLPPRTVAYLRVMDPYRPAVVVDAAARLVTWAESKGIADGQWLGYMWDDPQIVAQEDCRYDVGLVVDRCQPDGEVGCLQFPALHVAEIELRGGIDLEVRALDWIWRTWLPTSGYVPTDQPSFESWIGRPFEHGDEHFELRLQLPVERPLGLG